MVGLNQGINAILHLTIGTVLGFVLSKVGLFNLISVLPERAKVFFAPMLFFGSVIIPIALIGLLRKEKIEQIKEANNEINRS